MFYIILAYSGAIIILFILLAKALIGFRKARIRLVRKPITNLESKKVDAKK